MEKEITRRWTTRFAWKLVSVLAKSYYALSFSPFTPSLHSLFLSSLPFSVVLPPLRLSSFSLALSLPLLHPSRALSLFLSPYLFPSETSRCVRMNTSEKSFTLTNTDARSTSRIRPRLSFSPFLTLPLPLSLFSLLTRFSPPL